MSEYMGEKFIIEENWGNGDYKLKDIPYVWREDWLESAEKKPKLYNGTVLCVNSVWDGYVTVGKTYKFTDGFSQYDDGDRMPLFDGPVTSFEDLKKKDVQRIRRNCGGLKGEREMKKALTIYIDDDAKLTRICGTFLVEYDKTSINFVNEVIGGCNAVYFPNKATNENPIKFFKEVEQ